MVGSVNGWGVEMAECRYLCACPKMMQNPPCDLWICLPLTGSVADVCASEEKSAGDGRLFVMARFCWG